MNDGMYGRQGRTRIHRSDDNRKTQRGTQGGDMIQIDV